MNARRRSFIRKMVYVAVMIPLCFVLIYIGQPGTSGTDKTKAKPGGKLAQLRTENGLDQSKWGEIDPAGEAIKLATFGMRGVAANLLWLDAIEAKKKKDWTKLTATLNQAVKLQPNYVKVWEFQAWNLSYNCSAEFDDCYDRYRWVIKGVEFLQDGINYNKNRSRLYQSVGWTLSQKLGRADEAKEFREFFANDEEFFKEDDQLFYQPDGRPHSKRDNWLVGKDWYDKAADLIDNHGVRLEGDSALIFRSKPPMCLINYAAALEEDGIFGERAENAWRNGYRGWVDYGKVDIPASRGDMILHLGELDSLEKQLQEKSEALDKLLPPGTREKIEAGKRSKLSKQERQRLAMLEKMNPKYLTFEQKYELSLLRGRVKPTFDEVGNLIESKNQAKANKILKAIKKLQERIARTESNRRTVNYASWETRAKLEQTDLMLKARKAAYQAKEALEEGADLVEASEKFKKSIAAWKELIENAPQLISGTETVNSVDVKESTLMQNDLLMTDTTLRDDIDDLIESYGDFLGGKDALFPENFPLAKYVYERVQQDDKMPNIIQAREKAIKAIGERDWALAQKALETEFGKWVLLMADIPSVAQGSDREKPKLGQRKSTTYEILDEIKVYANVLQKQNKPFPKSFLLHNFVRPLVGDESNTKEARNEFDVSQEAFAQKDYKKAEQLLIQSIDKWQKILQEYPSIIGDQSLCQEMIKVVNAYRKALQKQKKTLPKVMPLQQVLDRWEKEAS